MINDFVILEGCDGVGKTTIVNKLKNIGYKSLHFGFESKFKLPFFSSNLAIIKQISKIC